MNDFINTDAGRAFIASAASRQTDERIMRAIAFFAETPEEADNFWNGNFNGRCDYLSIWGQATCNGALDAAEMVWGQTNLAMALASQSAYQGRLPKLSSW